jgi:hypothetical protein
LTFPTAKAGDSRFIEARSHRESDGLSASIFRLRVPRGDVEQSEAFGPDVPGRVEITVVSRPARAEPFPSAERQSVVESATLAAELAGGEPPINDDEVSVVPGALVRQLPVEFPQGGILHALGQLGSREAADGELLDAQSLMAAGEVGRGLVDEVASLVGDALMQPGDPPAGPLLAAVSALAAGEAALRATEAVFCFPEVARRGDAGAVG